MYAWYVSKKSVYVQSTFLNTKLDKEDVSLFLLAKVDSGCVCMYVYCCLHASVSYTYKQTYVHTSRTVVEILCFVGAPIPNSTTSSSSFWILQLNHQRLACDSTISPHGILRIWVEQAHQVRGCAGFVGDKGARQRCSSSPKSLQPRSHVR